MCACVCVCWYRRCLYEILRAAKLGAAITMVFPKEDQASFFRAVTTDFETVCAVFEAFSVADADATVEADKWMIWALIQSECGPRKAVESICNTLGLDTSGKVRRYTSGLLLCCCEVVVCACCCCDISIESFR